MAKNKGPHSSRLRKNPRYNRPAKAQRLRREKEKQRRSNEKTDSDAIFLDQEPIKSIEIIQKKVVLNLIEDLRNVPNHVFGEHNKCKKTCKRKVLEPDEIVHPLMSSLVYYPHNTKLPGDVRIASITSLNPPGRKGSFHARCYDARGWRP
ncbi:hypothetical protein AVEN_72479-1 [Araneus ventricosus]|uniref:Uncharacterized protein n=1 Tax=Araneus ventricosus TaxID=182803 RepID=A0A4Y2G302_ARAVE|nr:hypothetical protein AVEN_72479-1 [Araneus ventricosus]